MRLVVMTVLYEADSRSVVRLVRSVELAAASVRGRGEIHEVVLALGDCGSPNLAEDTVRALPADASIEVRYEAFGENLGHSGGCNAIVRSTPSLPDDRLVFLNPDALPDERALGHLVNVLAQDGVGVVDARQLPLEHPKAFDPVTFEHSWASGACLGVRRAVFEQVGGFDAEHFWSYCNDVDLSWRVRLTGLNAVHIPEAIVFHDKRLDTRGRMLPTPGQDYQTVLGRLNLATRYGRPDLVRRTTRWIRTHGTDQERAAVAEYRRRVAQQRAPDRLPGASTVAEFVGGDYAPHRF